MCVCVYIDVDIYIAIEIDTYIDMDITAVAPEKRASEHLLDPRL